MEFTSTEDGNRPVDQSDGANTTRRSEANQSPDPLHSCPILSRNEPERLAATRDQDERLAGMSTSPATFANRKPQETVALIWHLHSA